MRPRMKKAAKFLLRWGIAVAGIYWVVANISLHDRVMVADPHDGWPLSLRLAEPAGDQDQSFKVIMPDRSTAQVPQSELLVRADRDKLTIRQQGRQHQVGVLALKVSPDPDRSRWPIIVAPPRNLWDRYWNRHTAPATVAQPADVVDDYFVSVPHPIIERGVLPMVRNADPLLIVLAFLVMPITFMITSIRWHALLKVVGIRISLTKTIVVNMVGAFYNTFMPGSTGGDVLKAYYAAKLAPEQRTRAVMSVIVDRAIGLLALIILGGLFAGYLALGPGRSNEVVRRKCLQVAVGSSIIIGATVAVLIILYSPLLRKWTGLHFLGRRLPMQKQVQKAMDAMQLYRSRPWVMLAALVGTFPVHMTVIVSAMFAGMAFGLPLKPWYYWVVVPVVVLSGSVPISPQGAGVMEFFAIILTRPQGATVSQAFALTMSIRIVQILWNLTGGIFVLTGGYHPPAPTEHESLADAPPDVAPVTR